MPMEINIEREFNIKKREKCCCILGAGDFYGMLTPLKEGDLIIAADGGLKYAIAEGLSPDIVLGDFDSSLRPEQGAFETMCLSPIKDLSDLSEALSEGIKRGFKLFYIYGCTGGRPDHTYAALQDIARLSKEGITAFIFDKDYAVTALSEGRAEFPDESRGMVSVFAQTDVCTGVTESGFKYTVADHILKNDTPLGLSNEFTGLPAVISVKEGTLIIMFETKAFRGGDTDGSH